MTRSVSPSLSMMLIETQSSSSSSTRTRASFGLGISDTQKVPTPPRLTLRSNLASVCATRSFGPYTSMNTRMGGS